MSRRRVVDMPQRRPSLHETQPRGHRFSTHAVERFVQRIAPEMTLPAALTLLVDRARSGKSCGRTLNGEEKIRISDPDAILVVRREPSGPFVMTVLPVDGAEDAEDGDEMLRASAPSRDPLEDFVTAAKELANCARGAFGQKGINLARMRQALFAFDQAAAAWETGRGFAKAAGGSQ